jgi:hypothetical protein
MLKPEEKKPLGRPRRRWEDNINMDVREIKYKSADYINLVQEPVPGFCEHGNEHRGTTTDAVHCWLFMTDTAP